MAGFFCINFYLQFMDALLNPAKCLLRCLPPVLFGLLLTACALPPVADLDAAEASLDTTPWAMASLPALPIADRAQALPQVKRPDWHHYRLPGKQATRFTAARTDDRPAMAVTAVASASMLRKTLRVEAAALGKIRFSWKVPALIEGADLTHRDSDDSPVRIVLAFEGDRSRFSAKNAMLSELALALTGEELPYATLMYVWGNHRDTHSESVIVNSRTDRVRKLVLESGPDKLNRWLDYERDICADYQKAFGEAPGALLAIGIMTDTDNTRASTTAWYGPVTLAADVLSKK